MATKTGLISAINGFISAVVTITKHRNSMLEVVNEFYGSVITDTETANTITTPSDATNVLYNLKICKQGRVVNVSGNVTNDTAGIVSGISVCTFDGDYAGDAGAFYGHSNTAKARATVFESEFQIIGSMAAGETMYFDFNYFTTD